MNASKVSISSINLLLDHLASVTGYESSRNFLLKWVPLLFAILWQYSLNEVLIRSITKNVQYFICTYYLFVEYGHV